MSRTWLLRIAVAAVAAVLVGAWALGAVRADDSSAPEEKADVPVPTDTATPDEQAAVPVEKARPRQVRDTAPSEEPLDETTPDSVDAPAPDPATTPEQASTPRPPVRTPRPSPSSPKPTPSPTQPEAGCTDLVTMVDCVLAPVTTRP